VTTESDAQGRPGAGTQGRPGVPPPTVYHLQLRQFPNNMCRFNIGERELRATVIEPWAREQWVDLGERKWNRHQAKLTVIEGPPIAPEKLSMGRGWRIATRDGRDVTDALIASVGVGAGSAAEVGGRTPGAQAAEAGERTPVARAAEPGGEALLADSLGLELLAAVGKERAPLRRAWELAAERFPDRGAGECLALAERAVISLARSRLIELVSANSAGGVERVDEQRVESLVRRIDSWAGVGVGRREGEDVESRPSVWMSRV
jgi:hypothetical protein